MNLLFLVAAKIRNIPQFCNFSLLFFRIFTKNFKIKSLFRASCSFSHYLLVYLRPINSYHIKNYTSHTSGNTKKIECKTN